MEDALARVPPAELMTGCIDVFEPVAEVNFNRKKMLQIEQGMSTLQKAARQHNEVVQALEGGMKAMISETDLRRAIGLAFQEFELRLEDSFQDSNRKCLTMFARRDEVSELQGLIGKKVNWSDYNVVMKKLADLRSYIDVMAESVFIGHREALNGEFAKKADRMYVDDSLSVKANNDDLNEVRARLERLEVLVSHHEARRAGDVEQLRQDIERRCKESTEKHSGTVTENASFIAKLQSEQTEMVARLRTVETRAQERTAAQDSVREIAAKLQTSQNDFLKPAIDAMEKRLSATVASAAGVREDVRALSGAFDEFRGQTDTNLDGLVRQVKTSKDHVEFLLQEADAIKRRAKEQGKKHAAGLQELTGGQDKLGQQLQAIERDVKKQGRDMRVLENKTAKALDDPAAQCFGSLSARGPAALTFVPGEEAREPDANDRLKVMMEQLERLAMGGPPNDGMPVDPARPPLQHFAAGKAGAGAAVLAADLTRLPRFSASEPAPIDSARGIPATSATARSMVGLSPRLSPGGGAPGKKKR